ncbi:hypothetical protein [Candidatus Mycoplasma haematominutum]|uniref:Uncharacterized protein n=1 Tax=Candidatus Mycoplasma haematominutum 'Birmingham 1' TaxID=1116213 RepID=G8C3C1_9MOLU|nr:hypothetical protein [Candidatus Mycoplasma haematominutum]CCE66819.1 hypothetical protein (homolog to MSU_0540) [Candidatus Mycoplasma haematominutum 'Birmingham 1']
MGTEWAQYSIFGVVTLIFLGFIYQWNKNPKARGLEKLLKFRRELFGLRKDFLFLIQKKDLHDSKVESFLSGLKVPSGRGVSAKKVTTTLDKKSVEFKQLVADEQVLLLCKRRILELIRELEELNSKALQKALKSFNKKGETENWEEELSRLKEETTELKDNHSRLSHGFLDFQEKARKKLLTFKTPA